MWVWSFPTKTRRLSAHGVPCTSVKRADLVHDVTFTDCRTQNGTLTAVLVNVDLKHTHTHTKEKLS